MTLLEAMALGKPIVATAVGGIPDVITDGQEGLLVQAGDVEALTGALRRMVADAGLRRDCGRHARETLLARYDASRTAQAYEALYAACLGLPPDDCRVAEGVAK